MREDELEPVEPTLRLLPKSRVEALFAGGDPKVICARLSEGDPLRLEELCARRTRERSYLVDPDRVRLRTIAAIALEASRYRSDLPLEKWLRARVDDAVASLLRQDRADFAAGLVPSDSIEESIEPRFAYFVEALGIEPAMTLQAMVAFNDLPTYTRESFFALILEARPLREVLDEGFGPPKDLRLRIRTALAALTIITPDRIVLTEKNR